MDGKGKEVVVMALPTMADLPRAHGIRYGVKGSKLYLEIDMDAEGKHEEGRKNVLRGYTDGFGVKVPGTRGVFQGHFRTPNDDYNPKKDTDRIKKLQEEAKALGFKVSE